MTIYTRVGDKGTTRRPDGREIPKDDPLCRALGGIDELNATVGWCRAGASADVPLVEGALSLVQGELLHFGAIVATSGQPIVTAAHIDQAWVERMERQIDDMDARMPALRNFIIPGGCELAARLHVARTVARRSERELVAAVNQGLVVPPLLLVYINRLSDLLFALARWANHATGTAETPWKP